MPETRRLRPLIALLVVACLATASLAALAHHHGHGAVRHGARCGVCHFAQEMAATPSFAIPPPAPRLCLVGAVDEPAPPALQDLSVSTATPRAPPRA